MQRITFVSKGIIRDFYKRQKYRKMLLHIFNNEY